MDINTEVNRLREELQRFYTQREAEADNLLISLARLKYSGIGAATFLLVVFTAGFYTSKLFYGSFFCI